VFSPNAGGGVLDDRSIERLRCAAVVGGANEQLALPVHAEALHARGILYAPDYLVNAGGLLSLLHETGETDEEGVLERVRAIGDRLRSVVLEARQAGCSPLAVADRIAERRLQGRRSSTGTRGGGSPWT
jgi:glutamate dehydrogenase/leucine dehydrogenase